MASNRIRNVAFLSTYPPRECGLATFTDDLVRELDKVELINNPKVIAVSDNDYSYGSRVIMELSSTKGKAIQRLLKRLTTRILNFLL